MDQYTGSAKLEIDAAYYNSLDIPSFALMLKDPSYCYKFYWLSSLSYAEAKKLWACSDKIAGENYERLRNMDLQQNLTPAILAYDGIQYAYMAPSVFEDGQFDYVQENLRILSGFYGVVKPMDGVVPYRLEMQSNDRFITCIFGEPEGGKIVQKGVYAKMARGEMVRYMAVNAVTDPEQIKAFDWSGYRFDESRSTETEYVFIRTTVQGEPAEREE